MKIQIYSDLHREFASVQPAARTVEGLDVDSDVVILAGDIDVGQSGVIWAGQAFPGKQVIYVAGNHEFYNGDFETDWPLLRKQCSDHVHLLENQSIEIDQVRFLGCTLWTDYALFGADRQDESMQIADRCMQDHRVIRLQPAPFGHVFSTADALEIHRTSRAWLAAELAKPYSGKTVVVTHHIPHRNSIADRYRDQLLTSAFVSDLSELMGLADLWVHGHTHDSYDYVVNGTRVVSNPRGYPLKRGVFENPQFNGELVVTL